MSKSWCNGSLLKRLLLSLRALAAAYSLEEPIAPMPQQLLFEDLSLVGWANSGPLPLANDAVVSAYRLSWNQHEQPAAQVTTDSVSTTAYSIESLGSHVSSDGQQQTVAPKGIVMHRGRLRFGRLGGRRRILGKHMPRITDAEALLPAYRLNWDRISFYNELVTQSPIREPVRTSFSELKQTVKMEIGSELDDGVGPPISVKPESVTRTPDSLKQHDGDDDGSQDASILSSGLDTLRAADVAIKRVASAEDGAVKLPEVDQTLKTVESTCEWSSDLCVVRSRLLQSDGQRCTYENARPDTMESYQHQSSSGASPLLESAVGIVSFVVAAWVWTQLGVRSLTVSPPIKLVTFGDNARTGMLFAQGLQVAAAGVACRSLENFRGLCGVVAASTEAFACSKAAQECSFYAGEIIERLAAIVQTARCKDQGPPVDDDVTHQDCSDGMLAHELDAPGSGAKKSPNSLHETVRKSTAGSRELCKKSREALKPNTQDAGLAQNEPMPEPAFGTSVLAPPYDERQKLEANSDVEGREISIIEVNVPHVAGAREDEFVGDEILWTAVAVGESDDQQAERRSNTREMGSQRGGHRCEQVCNVEEASFTDHPRKQDASIAARDAADEVPEVAVDPVHPTEIKDGDSEADLQQAEHQHCEDHTEPFDEEFDEMISASAASQGTQRRKWRSRRSGAVLGGLEECGENDYDEDCVAEVVRSARLWQTPRASAPPHTERADWSQEDIRASAHCSSSSLWRPTLRL